MRKALSSNWAGAGRGDPGFQFSSSTKKSGYRYPERCYWFCLSPPIVQEHGRPHFCFSNKMACNQWVILLKPRSTIIIIVLAFRETYFKLANLSDVHAQQTHSTLILSNAFLGVLWVFTPDFAWKRAGHLRGSTCSLPQPFAQFRRVAVLGFLPLTCRLAHQLLLPPEIWLILGSNQSFPFFLVEFPVTASEFRCKHLCSKCKMTAADAFVDNKRLEEGQSK